MNTVSKTKMDDLLLLAKTRREEILNTKSEYPTNGSVYYVDAENGNDQNDGLSPETAFCSIERTEFINAKKGDAVLFKRGQKWFGTIRPLNGVTYSAYGEGEKPLIYGYIDASNPDDWTPTDAENVWMFKPMIPYVKDVGAVIFNEGECWGIKVCKNHKLNDRCDMYRSNGNRGSGVLHGDLNVWNGRKWVHRENGPFNGYKDLKGDLEFFHLYSGIERLYLNCADGNPAEVFDKIELSLRFPLARGIDSENVTFDNLCFRGAYYAIAMYGWTKNLVVRNCDFRWIGGSSMFPERYEMELDAPYGDDTTRLGNAVEIYGTCDGYIVDNCYFEQIYDTAITVQIHESGVVTHRKAMENMKWTNNVIDTTNYCFELWMTVQDPNGHEVYMKDVDISGNICINNGYGWAHQRPDPCYYNYYGGRKDSATYPFINCALHDNIFINGKSDIVSAAHVGADMMEFYNNKIYHNKLIGHFRENLTGEYERLAAYNMDDETIKLLEDTNFIGKNEYNRFDEEILPESNIIKF